MKDNIIRTRKCFGTKEFSKDGKMCKSCPDYIECKLIVEENKDERKI